MNYANLYQRLLNAVDAGGLLNDINSLTAKELPQTHSANLAAADFAAQLIRKAGLDVEIFNFPVDGKSCFQDKFMPYAWECSKGRLTVVQSPVKFDDPVIADYERHPFHLMRGSEALPEGGKYFKLISYQDVLKGADTLNTLCMLPPDLRSAGQRLRNVLELGCAGVVSDYLKNRYDAPDGIAWANGNTPGERWHFSCAEPNYLGFSVSPRTGDALRAALTRGAVMVKAECDGRNFEAALPTVTATIKGRSEEEVWLISHLYEPLADDNSSGVCACIEIAKQLKRLISSGVIPKPEHTLRIVFSLEFHGFAAFTDQIKGKKVIGAINMDAMPLRHNENVMRLFMSPPPLPSAGNALMRETVSKLKHLIPWEIKEFAYGDFQDDQAISDPLVGVPVLWPMHPGGGRHWHNSCQTIDIINPENLVAAVSFVGCWATAMLSGVSSDGKALGEIYLETLRRLAGQECVSGKGNGVRSAATKADFAGKVNYIFRMLSGELEELGLEDEQKKLADECAAIIAAYKEPEADAEKNAGVWFEGSAATVITRLRHGLPYDFCSNPGRPLAIKSIYTPTGRVLAASDGKKNLQQLIRETEYQLGRLLSDAEIKVICRELNELARYGYVSQEISNRITADGLRAKLRELGIRKGDLLMVHSAVAALGPSELSPKEINDILLEAVGEEGTLLMPAFTSPYIHFEGASFRDGKYRPAAPDVPANTGSLVNQLMTRPECCRDRHTTHAIAGIGKHAAELLAKQGPFDPPTGVNSAWHELAPRKGKILYLGSGIACNTYLHYLETLLDLWYLGCAVIRYKDEKGECKSALIQQHLAGCRDFYKGEKCKFYDCARARGMKIGYATLGYAGVHLMEAEELYKIGTELLKEDPALLLCDSEKCFFCVNAKERLKA